ncbi:class I SAM-dependent methyltransferase [Planctomycetota bacterium]|nr:class I SAM-dependent methyltransferase [Planctomycetota bacterium]
MARDPDIQREWQRLFDRFATRLRELRPASVLDVGCGRGALVRSLVEDGITATGIEPSASGDEPNIQQGDATKLPFEDDSIDWVTLRHVPHHLADLPVALTESVRVAQDGLLIAEPWFDTTDEVQRRAELWDRWWKRQHERAGQVHKPCMTMGEIKRALPEGQYDIEAEYYRHDALIMPGAIAEISKPLLEALPEGDPDRAEYNGLIQHFQEYGFSYNGTMILTVRLALTT